ncbi:hypothetical protein GC101_19360 [Paenibacillus sp. LMG 31459]|uniref:Uncharacterized protein n=1 Tax=Paenibacillus phytohabitans TaxID=2654978 RepID=A0ABX1YL02_9BACL|nr:hypothetical protein [Paenibacillus phytohabitans]NOU81024.1 hypothetical protein [Paenibacillus phytohabitans]
MYAKNRIQCANGRVDEPSYFTFDVPRLIRPPGDFVIALELSTVIWGGRGLEADMKGINGCLL